MRLLLCCCGAAALGLAVVAGYHAGSCAVTGEWATSLALVCGAALAGTIATVAMRIAGTTRRDAEVREDLRA